MGSENTLGPLGFRGQPGFLGFGSVVAGFRDFGGCGAVEFAVGVGSAESVWIEGVRIFRV